MVLDYNLGNGSVLSKEFHSISEFSIIGVATPKGCHEVLWALLKSLTRHRISNPVKPLHYVPYDPRLIIVSRSEGVLLAY